jgi:MFS family permease
MGLWFAGNGVANIISGVIAYGIGNISSSLATWRLLFLILGGLTAAYGVVLLVFLPDSPSKARFLSLEERAIAIRRTLENKTGVMDEGNFKTNQMWEALRDPQAWLLALYTISVNIPNGSITTFNSILIHGFGFSPLNSLLLQMPAGVTQILALVFICLMATYIKNIRLVLMISMVLISLLGMCLVYGLPYSNSYGRLVGIWLCSPFAANIPISLSLISSNVGGFTKKATISAMLFIAYSAGNIIGPQFFFDAQKPTYPTGIRSALAGFCFAVFFLSCLLAYYVFENKKRDRNFGSKKKTEETEELAEDLSNKTDMQIKGFRYTI